MASPGVENTPADPNPGHERQESKDTQATLNGDGTNAAANDHRRSRKRAASDGSDDVDDAHEAKRFRVTAETPAGPTAAATTAQMTGSPTAAAPQNLSVFTTVAPAAVDNHHDATADEPEEVQDHDDEVAEAAPAQGRCRCTTTAYDDDDVVPPTCVWTTLEPAAIAYGIIPNFVDEDQTPWRLTVIPLPRGARRTEQRVNLLLPSCMWVRLGPAHFRYERDPDWFDDDGGAWRLLLIPPPRRVGPSAPAREDEASEDDWSGPEQVPFVAPQAGQEEECDCCCETSSSEPSDADEDELAEDDDESGDEWFAEEDDDESDDDEPMPPMPTVDQDAKDAEADLLMEKIKARVQNAIDDGEGSKWNNGHRLELVEGSLADDENTDEEDVEDDGDEADDDGEDECEEEDELEYVEEDDEELEYAD